MWTLISFALSLLAVVAAAAFGDIEIVGGGTIDISQAPYTISLRLNGGPYCGGSIISNSHILTAAHCVYGNSASSFSINAGSTNNKMDGVVVQVSRMAIHPNYIGPSNYWDHDVAVLTLAQQLPSNNKIKIIPMAPQGTQVPAGQTVMISGWGWTSTAPPTRSSLRMENNETDDYSYSAVLKAVSVPVVDNQSCRTQTGASITNNMMCAGGQGEGQCSGDSGGPAKHNGVLVGVVSWGLRGSCAQGKPSVQASVGALRSWIDSQMN